jgi:hypothetical protein
LSPMLFDTGLSSSLTAGGTDKRVFIPLRITCGTAPLVGSVSRLVPHKN